MLKTSHSDREILLIERRSAENWLLMHSDWISALREGTQAKAMRGSSPGVWVRRRLEAGVDYGVVEMTGNRSDNWWRLTSYAKTLIKEMGLCLDIR